MYTLQIKNWFHRIRMPRMPRMPAGHTLAARINQIVRDKYFWSMVGLAALIALFAGMFVWAIMHPELNRRIYEYSPYMMY